MILHKEIATRLRAGALVTLVEEPDEQLAVAAAKAAAKPFPAVVVVSAADNEALSKLEAHKSGSGTMIMLDCIRAYGNNPVFARLIREIAVAQTREKGVSHSRLILIEVPGVEVPVSLRSDIEYVIPDMPTVKELRSELDDFAEQHDAKIGGGEEAKHSIASAVAGLPRHEAARLFARCWIEKQALDAVWLRREKATRVTERMGGALTFEDADMPNVGGLGGLKAWLKTRKGAFGTEDAKKYGLPEPKGILIVGIPGTGKSLTAKAIRTDWGIPLLRFDLGKVFGSLVGQSEAQTRLALKSAEACAPCVLWLDEIEKGLAQGGLDGGTSQRVFGTILTWLQEKTAPVFVLATANDISALPPELMRKGRFDEIFFVDLPTVEERTEIAKIHVERHGRDIKTLKPAEIAKATEGFSGAEIEQAVIEAMFNAFADDGREVKLSDIVEAAKGTVPLSKTMERQIESLRAWAKGKAKMASLPVKAQQNGTPETGTRRSVALA